MIDRHQCTSAHHIYSKGRHLKDLLALSWSQTPQHSLSGPVEWCPEGQVVPQWYKRNPHNIQHNVVCFYVKAVCLKHVWRHFWDTKYSVWLSLLKLHHKSVHIISSSSAVYKNVFAHKSQPRLRENSQYLSPSIDRHVWTIHVNYKNKSCPYYEYCVLSGLGFNGKQMFLLLYDDHKITRLQSITYHIVCTTRHIFVL